MRLMSAHMYDYIMVLDLEFNIQFVNRAGQGLTIEQLIGKPPYIHVDKDEQSKIQNKLKKVVETRETSFYETEYHRSDGSIIYFESIASPIFTENKITGIVVSSRDITERKRVEESLRESKERLSAIVEKSPIPTAVGGSDGSIMSFNKALEELTGYGRTEINNVTDWANKLYPDQEYRDFVWKNIQQALRGEKQNCTEFTIRHKDGSARAVDFHTSFYNDGLIIQMVDITEQKKVEKTLITYQNDLRSLASKLTSTEEFQRRQIAADLHDNVSQTLALSVNQLRRLCKSAASGDAKTLDEACQMIEKSMQNVQDLTFDLASPTLYKIGLEAAISELLNEQLRDRHGIACKFSDDKKDKPLDDNIRVLLFQAVRELLVNVIKHAKAHKVEVAIQRENDKMQISVSDDGVGFDIQEAKTSIEGSGGFGLFNIRERIDYIDGSFEIHSQPGSGSRFILTAPIKTKTDLSPER